MEYDGLSNAKPISSGRKPGHGFRCAQPILQRGSGADGVAEIGFVRRDRATRLAHLYQHDPLRVLFPTPEPGDIPLAVLLTTSGGLVAGDRLTITIQAEENAAAQVTAAAAEKLYRSTGATTEITQHLSVGEAGWLGYLPPETILFDGAP